MTLDELREKVAASNGDEWQELDGPALIHMFFEVGGGGHDYRLTHDAHHSRAVLKTDLDVGLAWGLEWEEQFSEPWTERFPDKKASGHYADVLWRGQPVLRERYVTVDGGRYKIPLPAQTHEVVLPEADALDPDKYALMPYTVTPWQHKLMAIISAFSGGWDYEEGLRRAGVTVEH